MKEKREKKNLYIQIDTKTDRHKSFIDMRYNTEQYSKSNSIEQNKVESNQIKSNQFEIKQNRIEQNKMEWRSNQRKRYNKKT